MPSLVVPYTCTLRSKWIISHTNRGYQQRVPTERAYVTGKGIQNVRLRRTEGKMGPSTLCPSPLRSSDLRITAIEGTLGTRLQNHPT